MKNLEPAFLWFAKDSAGASWAVVHIADLHMLLEFQTTDNGPVGCLAFITPCCGSLFSHNRPTGLCNACGQDWTVGGGEWPNQHEEGHWRDGERIPRTVLFDRGFKPEEEAPGYLGIWLERMGLNPLVAEVVKSVLLTYPYEAHPPPEDLHLVPASNLAYKLENFYKFDVLKKTGAYSG